MRKDKILFTYPNVSSFVNKDVELLSQRYEVKCYEFKVGHKLLTPLAFAKQFIFLIFSIFKYRVVICQLAAYHSFLPVLLAKIAGKPSLIFLGGTDCAKFPSIRYGNFFKPVLGVFTAWSVRLATHLAPKHRSLIRFMYDYDDHDYPEQGIECFVKNFKTPYTIIHNGYDANVFKPAGAPAKNSFITVAADIGLSNIIELKGIDLILKVAATFPECTFTLAGVIKDFKYDNLPPNVVCLPAQSQKQLVTLFAEHQFYLQLSMSEGFPNAVCEAMLCGCIPIVSNVNALPDICGNTGFVLKRRNPDELVELIRLALKSNTEHLSSETVNHIKENFSIQQRQLQLTELIDKLTA